MMSPLLPSQFAQQVIDAISPSGSWQIVQIRHGSQGALPTAEQLAELLDVAFFASTGKEEGRQARFSMVMQKPSSWGVHRFTKAEPLSVEAIIKLSAACHADATALYIVPGDAGWLIWGIGVNVPPRRRASRVMVLEHGLVLTVRDAGVLTLRSFDDVIFRYAHGAGLILDSNTFVQDLIARVLPEHEERLQLHHLSAIVRAMRAHTRGGALLVVPSFPPANIIFRYPILQEETHPLLFEGLRIVGESEETYVIAPLAEAVRIENVHKKRSAIETGNTSDGARSHLGDLVVHEIEWTDIQAAQVGRLTAVDGIVAINHEMSVLGFGGKVPIPDDFGNVRVLHIDPRTGAQEHIVAKRLFSGMRHTSAAAACVAHGPGAMAVVQSQDGAMTLIVVQPDGELWAIRPLDRLSPLFER